MNHCQDAQVEVYGCVNVGYKLKSSFFLLLLLFLLLFFFLLLPPSSPSSHLSCDGVHVSVTLQHAQLILMGH